MQVGIFIAKVYDLFAILSDAIDVERKKSSTHLLKEVIDEWDQIFAKDVNLILLKCYRGFVESAGNYLFEKKNQLFLYAIF